MSVAFIPKSLANEIANLPILFIYVCAQPAGPVSASFLASPKTNHWVLYLAISDEQSLRLDPSPGVDGKITLIISRKSCVCSDAVKIIKLDVANLTAENFIKQLWSSNYIQYQFSTSGQGCRYWIHSVILLLQSAAYIVDDSQAEDATAALQLVWGTEGKVEDNEQSGIVPGTFY